MSHFLGLRAISQQGLKLENIRLNFYFYDRPICILEKILDN